MEKEIKTDLKFPFPYADGSGTEKQASFIAIKAPSNRVLEHLSVIDSAFALGQVKALEMVGGKEKKAEATDTSGPIDSSACVLMLSLGGQLSGCYRAFKEILLQDARLDGAVPFKQGHFDAMSAEDTKALLGLYVSNFMAARLS